MRKYQQELILEMLELCKCEQNKIKNIPSQNFGEIVDCLIICKEYAAQMIEFIEKMFGEGSKTVVMLEEYCNLIHQMNSEMNINDELLHMQINKVCSSVLMELKPDKIEIAFFPYKVSMADSLESIYLAAKADPQCDAYWIPIPYYDRKSDGSLGQMHYEGTEYSDDLEVTDWRSYDVEMQHPDIVFIHNPYDKFNLVTTVHPNYYSGILSKQSDFLVYLDYGLPYWVPLHPASSVKAEDIKLLPFQINCDLYVTYSHETAECCRLALLLSEATKNLYNQNLICEKVVPLGSPKFDNIINKGKENYKLPDNWKTVIANKKVLLYCTSIADILQNTEKFLNEVATVIRILSLQNDIVLWWRPHPLTSSTFRSMRLQYQAEYERIVNDFKCKGWGIFDDTADLHRSIAWSDACLTTESSLMFLYLASGKPFSVSSIHKRLANPIVDNGKTFAEPLKRRLENMRTAKGANVGDWNCCIWWDNFLEEDVLNNIHYENFLDRFIHFIVHTDEYPEAEEYKRLQLQMFRDFVVNPDGTAGHKIYEYCKNKTIGANI